MNLLRFSAKIEILFRSHILNWLWRSRKERRKVRTDVLAQVATQYFRRYLPDADALPLTKPIEDDANEKIYMIWLQGENQAPPLIKACIRSVRRHCTQELRVLNEKELFNYIDLPDAIMDKRKNGRIGNAHFADIARVELLHNHGGFWMDATDFVSSPIPKEIIDHDFFMFMAGESVPCPYSFVQNCFIRGRRGAYLLEAWRSMILDYWKHEPSKYDYFMHQLLFKSLVENDSRGKEYFAKMPHIDQAPTHALWANYYNQPFDQKVFDEITSQTFFQKTTYRDTVNLQSGTFADAMIKM
jgi:hypothetical protein